MVDLSGTIKQLVAELDRLTTAIATLQSLNGDSRKTSAKRTMSGKRTMSASARARISAAQRARWAKVRAKKQAR
jgi:hypothetical protein